MGKFLKHIILIAALLFAATVGISANLHTLWRGGRLGEEVGFVIEKGSYVAKLYNASKQAIKEIDWALAKQVQGLDEKVYTVITDPIEGLKNAAAKVKQVLRDAEGKELKDAAGNTLVEMDDGAVGLAKNVQGAGSIALDVANATEKQLDDIFAGLQNTPPFKYAPNTLEHKAERWAQYKIEKGTAAKDYSNWSNIYNSNMTKATKAHQAADEVMSSIGWGQREVTLTAGSYTRRMDIADINLRKGVEVKSYETGKVYATEAIKGELNADKFLVEMQNWQIEWVFKGCEPSQPLRTLLEQGGITIKLVP